jgi:secreted trypsin-like serine protease
MKIYISPLVILFECVYLRIGAAISMNIERSVRDLNSRIVGGTKANATRYPYYTYLRLLRQSGKISFCGGSLVNSDVVLTAAHCILIDPDPVIKYEAFVNYTQSFAVTWNLTKYVHVRDVIATIPHENYNDTTSSNDIALVILDKPVTDVSPVKLNDNARVPSDGDPLRAIGHGLVFDGETPGYSYYLNEVNVSVISFEDCNDSNSYPGEIDDASMICAGDSNGGKDTCYGDSGGPLFIAGSSAATDLQIGLTVFGNGCGLINYPTVYSRVSYFKKWIQENICKHSNMKPSFCVNSLPTRNPTKHSAPKSPSSKFRPLFRPTLAPARGKKSKIR